jgi:hypothetical protein
MIWIITGWDLVGLAVLGLVAWFGGLAAGIWWALRARDRWEDTAWDGGYEYRIHEVADQLAAIEADRFAMHLESPYPDITAPVVPLPAMPGDVAPAHVVPDETMLQALRELFLPALELVDRTPRLPYDDLIAANGGHDTTDASVDSIMLRRLDPELLAAIDTVVFHELPGASS